MGDQPALALINTSLHFAARRTVFKATIASMMFHAHRCLQSFGQCLRKDVIGIVIHKRAGVNIRAAVAFYDHPAERTHERSSCLFRMEVGHAASGNLRHCHIRARGMKFWKLDQRQLLG